MPGLSRLAEMRMRYRVGIALLATAAAWFATYLLLPELRADAPVIFFPLAVICSAYLAGPVGGLTATGFGAVIAAYFFLPPEGFGVSDLRDQVRLLLFIFLGGAISLFAAALQQSRLRIQVKSQALRESEDRLRMAAEAAGVGTWDWNVLHDELIWSDRCKALFGMPSDAQVTPSRFFEVIHPDDRDKVRAVRQQALAEHKDYVIEFRAVRPDGTIRWIMGKGRGLYDLRGRGVRMHGIAMDITQRKQVMDQLQQLNETLEQRVAERTAVAEQRTRQVRSLACELTQAEQRERRRLAEILHDHLQQLLVGARFSVSILHSQVREANLLEPVHQIDDLLLQSLEVSRTLTAELNPPVLNEGGLLKGLQWLADWMRDKQGLHVDVRTDGQVSPQSREVTLLLFQSVRELLLNIRKHARVDRAEVVVSRPDDDHIRIVVQDKGVGFDSQGAPPKGTSGSGFGLVSVRERLELLDGCLAVHSKSGEGTRITLEVPLAAVDKLSV